MILLMNNTRKNQAAADSLNLLGEINRVNIENLVDTDLSNAKDQLVVIDVNANNKFNYFHPKNFAETLLRYNLPSSVHSIIFLVSDTDEYQNLRTFSRHVLDRLEKEFNHKIIAYVPTDLNYEFTEVIPPDEKNTYWQILGVENKDESSQSRETKNKKLLWQGSDILHWITREQKSVNTFPNNRGEILFSL